MGVKFSFDRDTMPLDKVVDTTGLLPCFMFDNQVDQEGHRFPVISSRLSRPTFLERKVHPCNQHVRWRAAMTLRSSLSRL